ncbi:MFS transporter [Streptomyces sp. 549]|uniref:MFS transporter n=1 Tax=Streptomyces sp. 549 TaxID=3049076 RepID=UPI0024C2FF2E|nr:MFS transporter [Streptomyces sp. 549]MDK1475931.1 MFS transporter [Streptomyces sp. 549]
MPSPYRGLFAAPGTRSFTAAGLVGRMPIAMMGLGVVTMVSELTGAYGVAGALAATVALSTAALGPQVSRLVDRYGQRRVLRPAALVALTAVAALVLSTGLGWPQWTLFVFAAFAGCVPSLGSMIRARWITVFRDRPDRLHAAFSWESIVDELCFVFGPVLAIGLSTGWFPQAGPLAAAVFLVTGVFWLTSQRATEPAPHPRDHNSPGSALRTPGLWILVVTLVAVGAIFGAVDVATVAFAEEQDRKAAASLLLAVYALGSCVAGAAFGMFRPRGPAVRRWLAGVCAVGLSMIPLQLVGNLPFLAVALFLAGLTIAPTMVTTMALVGELVPRTKLTEGMTWASTGVAVGVALGASATGRVVDVAGAAAAYGVPAVAGALAVAAAVLGHRRLRPRSAAGRQEGTANDRLEQAQRPQERHLA